jgi:DNA-binding SARP family transcriptional activator/tetratricopeptide (TPR) repeat protein
MEFRLLGPLQVARDGRALRLGAARERSVLAVLLLNANSVVGVDALVDHLWPEAPPESAVHAVHVSISRLRRLLDDGSARRIETRKPGYLLRVESGELDLAVFVRLCAEGRTAAAAGDPESASAAFGDAAALWDGPALADLVDEPFAQAAAVRLAEARMDAVEQRIAADLELGRHARLVGELAELVAAHPLRERLRAQLMRALYGCGRQADALAVYRETRAVLVDELGVEPGPELRAVEASILAGETEPGGSEAGGRPPMQLPPVTAKFTGRSGELEQILALVAATPERSLDRVPTPGLIAICAVDGMGGIGKTTLALRAGHLLADRFPDGCLFIDLHGHTDEVAPVETEQALERLLRALGVPGDRIPVDPDDRAALYRSELAGRRTLVLLDNARDERHVRPLLPAAPGCLVLVTSRRRLSALDDATVLSLDVLPAADAVALFGKIVGVDRVAGHDDAVRHIVNLCGQLPLAVRIAAARLRSRPAWTPEQLAARLAGEHLRLRELEDSDRSVAAVFAVSYRDLDDEQRRLFRLLGLHPGSDLDGYAAAALAGTEAAEAERLLEELLDVNLLGQSEPGRYRFHDLMRAYAARLTAEQDTDADRQAAVTRLFDYYVHTTATAVGTLLPPRRRRAPPLGPPTTTIPPIGSVAEARSWMDAERATVVSLIVETGGKRWSSQAAALGRIVSPLLILTLYIDEAAMVNDRLLEIARARGDRVVEAAALEGRAWTDLALSRCEDAFDRGRRALELYREIGDGAGECSALTCLGLAVEDADVDRASDYFRKALVVARRAGDDEGAGRALNNLASACDASGRFHDAIRYLTRALDLHRRAGNPTGVSLTLLNLAFNHLRLGHDELAWECLREALPLARELGHRRVQPAAIDGIGQLLRRQGRYAEAIDHHLDALAAVRDRGDEEDEAHFLASLGGTRQAQGDLDGALGDLRRARRLADRTGFRALQAEMCNALGRVLLETGQAEEARRSHDLALDLSTPGIDRYQEARALDGIAGTCQCRGDVADARRFWLRALAIYEEMDVPEADDVRARLTAPASEDTLVPGFPDVRTAERDTGYRT